jgi:hypothetical protein
MLVRVDFMDLGDTLSVLSGAIRGFPAVHVGLRYGDYYLTVNRGEPSSWRSAASAERIVSKYMRSHFVIDPPDHDPMLVSLLGEGHVVSSVPWMVATEFMMLLPVTPKRTTCVGVVSTVLCAMGIPVRTTNPVELHRYLSSCERCYEQTKHHT